MSEPTLPRHVAFIMDGNGRWARTRGLLRLKGHECGAEALRRISRHAARLGIPEITFFALSTENFRRRPREEIDFLMDLLVDFLAKEREELSQQNIRLKTIGRIEEFPERVREEIRTTVRGTASHTGMVLRLALNYGSRQEILEGIRKFAEGVQAGDLDPEALDEEGFRRLLYDPEMPDPDLLIRTAGEIRLSNFFLWQASYTEIWVTDVFWPDFEESHFEEGLRAYAARSRKFGAVEPVRASLALNRPEEEGPPSTRTAPAAVPSGALRAGG